MSRTFSREDLNDAVLNPRLEREKAKTGQITASLVWNGRSDLDLHAKVSLATGKKEHIFFRHKVGTGGTLDVDANARDVQVTEEPVENIYWKEPPQGKYVISVENYKTRGDDAKVPFRVQLKLPEETLDYEGSLSQKEIATCFQFTVDSDGAVTMGRLPLARIMKRPSSVAVAVAKRAARAKRAPKAKAKGAPRAMKVMKVMKPKAKPKAKAKAKAKAKSKVAKGKYSKSLVFSGKFEKTTTGKKKDDLMKNKRNKVVTKTKHLLGKKTFATNLKKWVDATQKAKAELGLTGFVKLKKGTEWYNRAKEIYAAASA